MNSELYTEYNLEGFSVEAFADPEETLSNFRRGLYDCLIIEYKDAEDGWISVV